MPWTLYAGITEEDLRAIFAYLRTVPPVSNEVEIYTPPPGFVPPPDEDEEDDWDS